MEKKTQRDRQIDRERQIERQRDRETDRQIVTEKDGDRDEVTEKCTQHLSHPYVVGCSNIDRQKQIEVEIQT